MRVLDEGPAVDIADVRLVLSLRLVVRAKDVEAADGLPEGQHHLARDLLLLRVQDDGVAYFLATLVAHHAAVDDGALSCLGVRVVGPDGIDLHVGALSQQQLLVDVRVAVAHPRRVHVRVEGGGTIAHLEADAAVRRCSRAQAQRACRSSGVG